jgi:hypothetical protein
MFLMGIAAASASAGGIREVELTDGASSLERSWLTNGVYTVKSRPLGR